jgi:hypothetical protein
MPSYFKYLFSSDDTIPKRMLNKWKRRKVQTETSNYDDDQINGEDDQINGEEDQINGEDDQINNSLTDNDDKLEQENGSTNDLNDSIKSLLHDKDFSKIDLYGALLSLFFSSKLSQSAFSLVLDFVELISEMDAPKDFDDCGNTFLKLIGEQKIAYSKKWYCKSCNLEVNLNTPKQRMCYICCKR